MNYSSQDVTDISYCAWMEARGDGQEAMRAVQHVVVNRVKSSGFPKTIHEVVYQPNAFSWTIPGNPEYGKQPPEGDLQDVYSKSIASTVLSGADSDNTLGATYYANESQVTSGWYYNVIMKSGKFPVTVIIGQQTFRKAV